MAITGFWLDREVNGGSDVIVQIPGANATQFSEGDACIIDTSTSSNTAGTLIQVASQTASPRYVVLSVAAFTGPNAGKYLGGAFPSGPLRQTTYNLIDSGGEPVMVIDAVASFNCVLATQFAAATFDGTACNSNSTTNNILFTGSGSTDDLTGGQVYVNETNQQFTIVKDSVSGGVHTLTIWPAAPVAVTTGNTIRAVPWGPGYNGGVKLQSSSPQQGISVAVADKTSGHLLIEDVNLARRIAYVRFSGNGIIAK